jgi:hypothetical protein
MKTQSPQKKAAHRQKTYLKRRPKDACFVYVLCANESSPPVYVGQTQCDLQTRLQFHIKSVKTKVGRGERLSPVQRWLKTFIDVESMPTIKMLDKDGIMDISEAVWIDRLLTKGFELLNVTCRVSQSPAFPI